MAKRPEKITLQAAYLRYRIPISTMRLWLDKGELSRAYDDRRRVVVDVGELEARIGRWREWHAQRPSLRDSDESV